MAEKKKTTVDENQIDDKDYAIVRGDDLAYRLEILKANMGGEQIDPLKFPRITVPSSDKSIKWSFTDEDGAEQSVDALRGVPCHITGGEDGRVYYIGDMAGNRPPDCSAVGGGQGFGIVDPETEPELRDCASCPRHAIGGGCKPKARLAMMLTSECGWTPPESILPTTIMAPTKSLSALTAFRTALGSRGQIIYATEIVLRLVRDKSKDGVGYCRMTVEKGRDTPMHRVAEFVAYHRLISQMVYREPEDRLVKLYDLHLEAARRHYGEALPPVVAGAAKLLTP